MAARAVPSPTQHSLIINPREPPPLALLPPATSLLVATIPCLLLLLRIDRLRRPCENSLTLFTTRYLSSGISRPPVAKSKGKDKGKRVGNTGPRDGSGGLLGTYFKRLPAGPPPDNVDARRGPAASADEESVDDDDNERIDEVSDTPGAARIQDRG